MGNFVVGKFELEILQVKNTGDSTDRYYARVINAPESSNVKQGDRVTVKFSNHNKDPNIFVGQTGIFDGDDNDIQDNPYENIALNRPGRSIFKNPFVLGGTVSNPIIIETTGESKMEYYIKLLKENHNLILTGAPGTGKTYLAKEIAKRVAFPDRSEEFYKNDKELEDNEYYNFIQFHPSYDYTDFVEGLRPIPKGKENEIGFELKNGIFKEFCQKALDKDKQDFIFVIDEINRGEISKIFGELFFSVDPGYRGEKGKVKTQYTNMQSGETIFDPKIDSDPEKCKGWFYIPKNVYIIGTMNDIDRSVESFDFAMRRRFVWQEITAKESAEAMALPDSVKKRMDSLNNAISNPDIGLNSSYHIGAAYFLKEGKAVEFDNNDYKNLWELRLEPLLREYLRGMPDPELKQKQLEDAFYLKSTITEQDDSDD